MSRSPARVRLTAEEEATLRGWARKGTAEQRLVERAKIILLCHEGVTVENIARQLDTRPARVSKWRQRFAKDRLSALSDAPRPGKPRTYDTKTESRVVALLDQPAPEGYAQWNGPLLAKALGDVSADQGLAHPPQPRHPTAAPPQLVHHHRPRVRPKSCRCGGALSEPAGKRCGRVRR